jgi:lysophospholipase L1-like esterase
MRLKPSAMIAALFAALLLAAGAPASDGQATHYYLSLGDSLATGTNAAGDGADFTDLGYAEQLYASLVEDDPKLELVKLGCPGESAASMRYGSQSPSVVFSCGSPRYYKNFLYSKGTQLAEAVSFLEAHKGKVVLVTIDIGANDLSRFDPQFNVISCLLEPQGCGAQVASVQANLTAILAELRAAAGPAVPMVGMTYYDVFAPLCLSDPSLLFICARVDAVNATLATTYAAAGVPVADVAGAFGNDNLPAVAANVCSWTWFCSADDVHPNVKGYGVIAQAFLDLIEP